MEIQKSEVEPPSKWSDAQARVGLLVALGNWLDLNSVEPPEGFQTLKDAYECLSYQENMMYDNAMEEHMDQAHLGDAIDTMHRISGLCEEFSERLK